MIDFSFIMPSRGDKNLIKKTLDSFERTTFNKKGLEFLIVFDEGTALDVPDFIESQKYGFSVRCYYVPHSEWWTRDYFNFLANKSIGKNICAFNDDAWIKTVHWDKKIRRHIEESGWSIYLLDIPDSARIKYCHSFPCFPMISKNGVIATGFFFHEQIKVYPADHILHSVYCNINRIIKVEDVFIQHDHIIETDPSKSRLYQVFLEQKEKGELNIDISIDVMNLLRECSKETSKRNKIKRIINIIKEK